MTHTIDRGRAREAVAELLELASRTDSHSAADAYQSAAQALLAAVGADVLDDLDLAAEAMLKVRTTLATYTQPVALETLDWLTASEEVCFEGWRASKQESARRLREAGIDQYGRREVER